MHKFGSKTAVAMKLIDMEYTIYVDLIASFQILKDKIAILPTYSNLSQLWQQDLLNRSQQAVGATRLAAVCKSANRRASAAVDTTWQIATLAVHSSPPLACLFIVQFASMPLACS